MGSELYGKASFRLLGKRLGSELAKSASLIKNLTDEQLVDFDNRGTIELDGKVFNKEEIVITKRVD